MVHEGVGASTDFSDSIIGAIPALRAFGRSLTGDADRADDLVQETLVKAWRNQDSYQPGTNIRAWLHTILRNEFYTQMRKRRREVEDANDQHSRGVAVAGGQEDHLNMADMRLALEQLPEDQREAIILVGASGFSYQEAAAICGVAVGTVKSRVSRAREKLAILLGDGEALHTSDKTGSEPVKEILKA